MRKCSNRPAQPLFLQGHWAVQHAIKRRHRRNGKHVWRQQRAPSICKHQLSSLLFQVSIWPKRLMLKLKPRSKQKLIFCMVGEAFGPCTENVLHCTALCCTVVLIFVQFFFIFQASICTEKAYCCIQFRHLGSDVGPRLGLVRDIYSNPIRYDGLGGNGSQKSALEIRHNEIQSTNR